MLERDMIKLQRCIRLLPSSLRRDIGQRAYSSRGLFLTRAPSATLFTRALLPNQPEARDTKQNGVRDHLEGRLPANTIRGVKPWDWSMAGRFSEALVGDALILPFLVAEAHVLGERLDSKTSEPMFLCIRITNCVERSRNVSVDPLVCYARPPPFVQGSDVDRREQEYKRGLSEIYSGLLWNRPPSAPSIFLGTSTNQYPLESAASRTSGICRTSPAHFGVNSRREVSCERSYKYFRLEVQFSHHEN